MICPKCAYERTKVVATIKSTTNERWRRCPKCGCTFSTIEIIKVDKKLNEYSKEILKDSSCQDLDL
ncbi:transcriptional repressor NrdR [Campylobacter hyointestinalis]|uniref:Transcriptional repressor NrdR n=1 Tax=Campylobacter hyointestinalis subsp. hyointestinalis TaxID=91352 RepID=A0A0S4SRA5_CAMHY|nr:hypothetical protein [Campylobacter hyointestinalis]CUU88071.1 transcriptional repressor NrdR [Campylobacter hyointestinalis subsp. hyointestinalis]CUU88916.1 transcriptional repressor NrdR [Campylobacter hyointestinalis]